MLYNISFIGGGKAAGPSHPIPFAMQRVYSCVIHCHKGAPFSFTQLHLACVQGVSTWF